jgi:hypothetical protein
MERNDQCNDDQKMENPGNAQGRGEEPRGTGTGTTPPDELSKPRIGTSKSGPVKTTHC